MKRMLPLLIVALFFICNPTNGQEIKNLVLTDHLSGSSKLGYGKPKPAPAKENFTLVTEGKGTQVMVFADLIPDENLQDPYILKFIAYKIVNGKDEWIDDRELPTKNTAGYTLTAFNFFEPGTYKIVVTDHTGTKILSQQKFTILK